MMGTTKGTSKSDLVALCKINGLESTIKTQHADNVRLKKDNQDLQKENRGLRRLIEKDKTPLLKQQRSRSCTRSHGRDHASPRFSDTSPNDRSVITCLEKKLSDYKEKYLHLECKVAQLENDNYRLLSQLSHTNNVDKELQRGSQRKGKQPNDVKLTNQEDVRDFETTRENNHRIKRLLENTKILMIKTAELEKENEKLDVEKTGLTEYVTELLKDREDSFYKNKHLYGKNLELLERIKTTAKERDRFVQQLNEMAGKYEEAKNKIIVLEENQKKQLQTCKTCVSAASQNELLKQNLTQTKHENDRLITKNDELLSKINTRHTLSEQTKIKLQQTEARNSQLHDRVEELEMQLRDIKKERGFEYFQVKCDFETESSQLKAREEKLKDELMVTKSKLDEYRLQNTMLKNHQNEIKSYRCEEIERQNLLLKEKETALECLSRDNDGLRIENNTLKKRIGETQDQLVKIEEEMDMKNTIETQIKLKRNTERSTAHNKVQTLSDENARLLNHNDELQKALSHSDNELARIQTLLEEKENAFIKKREVLEAELEFIREKLDSTQVEVSELNHALKKKSEVVMSFTEGKDVEIQKAYDEINELKQEILRVSNENDELRKLLQSEHKEIGALKETKSSLEEKNRSALSKAYTMEVEYKQLKEMIILKEHEVSSLKLNIDEKDSKLLKMQNACIEMEELRKVKYDDERNVKAIHKLGQENKSITVKYDNLKREYDLQKKDKEKALAQAEAQFISETENLKTQIRMQREDCEKQLRMFAHTSKPVKNEKTSELKTRLEEVTNELMETKRELDDTKTRLSKMVGQNLTNINPDIANLSDVNRPTKLGERFSELYDNQWTDAYEVIDDDTDTDKDTIDMLIAILNMTMDYCKEETAKQMENLKSTIYMSSQQSDLDAVLCRHLKHFRKTSAVVASKHAYKAFWDSLQSQNSRVNTVAMRIPEFLKECFQISWLMCVQDPPVVISSGVRSGEPFVSDVYRAYTAIGPQIEYVVWPALYLHEGGPLLCKGVAQGCGAKKK